MGYKRATTYMKVRVLGAVEAAAGETVISRIKHVSEQFFEDEDGYKRQFTWKTIQTWYSTFKKYGAFPNEVKARKDKGQFKKCSPEELFEAINQAMPHFRIDKVSKTQIYRWIIEQGIIPAHRLSKTTFWRFTQKYDLLKPAEENKHRKAFSMRYANELWQGDTMHGPHVNAGGNKRKTYLIALLDDASRLITHGEFFFNDDKEQLMKVMRSGFYKCGVPERLYFDNGSNYSCKEVSLICARLGTILCHAPVRDRVPPGLPAAKGKIERFFRTVRMKFLSRQLDLSSLEILNKQFNIWLTEEYNDSLHSTLQMVPRDRFNLDIRRINFLPPHENRDELFYFEETRKVKKDNTFSFQNARYEAPSMLCGKEITVRFSRIDADGPVIVYHNNERQGKAEKIDFIHNAVLRRYEPSEEQKIQQDSIFRTDSKDEGED